MSDFTTYQASARPIGQARPKGTARAIWLVAVLVVTMLIATALAATGHKAMLGVIDVQLAGAE